jgi:hypothetical protein
VEVADTTVKNTFMLRVSTNWLIEGTSVSMLMEDMLRNKMFFPPRFDYHMFYVLCQFVTIYWFSLLYSWFMQQCGCSSQFSNTVE